MASAWSARTDNPGPPSRRSGVCCTICAPATAHRLPRPPARPCTLLIESGPTDLQRLLVSSPDGHDRLILWRNVALHDPATRATVRAPAEVVRLRPLAEWSSAQAWSLDRDEPIGQWSGTTTLDLQVGGQVIILDVRR